MGSFGVGKSKRKTHNYRFVPRPKKESIPVSEEQAPLEAHTAEPTEVAEPVAPKRKTAVKSSKKKEE